jgi:hypothetical protein
LFISPTNEWSVTQNYPSSSCSLEFNPHFAVAIKDSVYFSPIKASPTKPKLAKPDDPPLQLPPITNVDMDTSPTKPFMTTSSSHFKHNSHPV